MLDKPSGGSGFSGAADALAGRRRIWLCADDYGISTAVNMAIRDLVVRRRLNATSASSDAAAEAIGDAATASNNSNVKAGNAKTALN